MPASPQVTVVVGVDGAGRTHRLDQIAAGGPAVRVNPPATQDLTDQLTRAEADGSLVLVDDAHRLAPDELAALAAAARRGVPMVIARRPTIDSPGLAELDEAVGGRVEALAPLDGPTLVGFTGWTPNQADALAEASGGLPAIAAGLEPSGSPSPSLIARVQRRLAVLDPATAGLARLLAVRLDLDDRTLAEAAGLDRGPLAEALRTLHDNGFLVGEVMIPAVAEAVLREPAERRRAQEAVARALVATGADVMVAAAQLRAARARTPTAADAYRAAGDRIRFDDPAAAIVWYDDALEAGCDAAVLAAGRAEAAALLGLPVDTGASRSVPASDAARLAHVEGAVEAHHGRAGRAAEALAAAGEPGPLLAVPSLVATGRVERARAGAETPGPPALRRLAEAAVRAVTDPAAAVPRFIEAAEVAEGAPPAAVLPDTPNALGALVALVAGDAASAEHLVERALASGIGGPTAVARHRLLLAWVRLRIGRYDTAVAELARYPAERLPGRERLLLAAVSAGLARRSGDIGRLRDAWTGVEQALARQEVDLFAVEQLEELAVAATRLRQPARVEPMLAALDGAVAGLGGPATWSVAVGWIRLQLAVAAEDAGATNQAAGHLSAMERADGLAERQRSQVAAAGFWGRILAGDVDPDAVTAVADRLAAAELPWEASRLVGQAAIRTNDPAAARRLLERARELSSAEVVSAEGRGETQRGGLSEREVEVARMVLAGGTYREIGGRLFISPKTVEHHVARIRTKLGATTRAEFVAALREVLGEA